MSTDLVADVLLFSAVIPATVGPFVYMFVAPWYKTHVGRALMTSWFSMFLLVDISAIYQVFGDDYPGRSIVRVVVFALILAGLWYKLFALLYIRHRAATVPDA